MKENLVRPAFYISILLIVISLVKDMRSAQQFTGLSLRNRIAAARFLEEGKDPYYAKWRQGMSDRFLDPMDEPNSPYNRLTVTPAGLVLLFSPFANVDYTTTKYIFLFLAFACFAASIILFLRQCRTTSEKWILIIVASIAVLSTDAWHFHVERAQVYILYTFLLCLTFYFTQTNGKGKEYISGLIFGFSILLRPTFMIFLPVFVYSRNWKLIIGVAGGVALGVLFCLSTGVMEYWSGYFAAMSDWGKYHFGEIEKTTVLYPENPVRGEGIELFSYWPNWDIEDFSIQALALQYFHIKLYSVHLIVLFLIAAFLMIVILFRKKIFAFPTTLSYSSIFLLGFLLMMLNEYFIPAPRMNYNFVLWLFVFSILVLQYREIAPWPMALLVFGVLFILGFSWVTNNQIIGEALIWLGTFLHLYNRINKEVFFSLSSSVKRNLL